MLPKLVTKNVINNSIGGIVFTSEIISKNSINESDEKKHTENYSYLAERGKGVSNLTVEIIHKLMAQERT